MEIFPQHSCGGRVDDLPLVPMLVPVRLTRSRLLSQH